MQRFPKLWALPFREPCKGMRSFLVQTMYLSLQTECAFLVLIYQKSSITTLESFRAKLSNYVTVTSPTLGNADAFPYSSVYLLISSPSHSRTQSWWIPSLFPRSKQLKRASMFMASLKSSGHRTSHLNTLPSPHPHPSIHLDPPPFLSFLCHGAHCAQHLQGNVLVASVSFPPSAFFASSCFLCPKGLGGGYGMLGYNVNDTLSSYLTPTLTPAIVFSRKILRKGLWAYGHKKRPCCK